MDKKEVKEYIKKIYEVLEPIDNDEDLAEIFGELLIDYDLEFLGNLVKRQYEPDITSQWLEENHCYDEGNEKQGHIALGFILSFVEGILNIEDEERRVSFLNHTVRRLTNKEKEERGYDVETNWYDEDKKIDLNQLIAFEID